MDVRMAITSVPSHLPRIAVNIFIIIINPKTVYEQLETKQLISNFGLEVG